MMVPSQKKLKMVEKAVTKDTDLPEGWENPLLGNLVRITQGNSKLTKKMYSANGKYIAFSGSGPDGFLEFCEHEGEAIILSSVGARCGKCFKASGKWSAIANTAIIKPYLNDPTLFSYVFYLINNEDFWPKSGSAQPFVQIGVAQREARVPLPPLAEQQRIISKLEELFQRVNTTHQYLVKVQAILKRFRQSVLAAACSGRLTADWREKQPKLTSVNYSIQGILQQREAEWLRTNGSSKKYKPPQDVKNNELQELSKGWKYINSDALFSFITSGSRGWAKHYATSGPIFIRVGNLDHDTISLDLTEVQHVNPPAGQEKERTQVQLGDILISITADVGMVALVRDEIGEAYVNQHVAIARPVTNVFKPYLAWYLASREGGQIQFQDLQRGATKVGLGLDDIRSVAISFPPIEEQQEIVRRVESMFKLAETIEKRVAAATARAEKLSQSILAKAFRGELVPTEAELARREGHSYESASELLARIKSEPESKQASRKVRRNRYKNHGDSLTSDF